MTFEEALAACDVLSGELTRGGLRWRITIDNGEGLTAELRSSTPPRRPGR